MNTENDTTQLHRIHSQNFIVKNRKTCWEDSFEQGEWCIGENTVKQFLMEKDDEIEGLKDKLNRIKERLAFLTQGATIITEYDHGEKFTVTPYSAYIIRKTSLEKLL